jgi:hypothetical protein
VLREDVAHRLVEDAGVAELPLELLELERALLGVGEQGHREEREQQQAEDAHACLRRRKSSNNSRPQPAWPPPRDAAVSLQSTPPAAR